MENQRSIILSLVLATVVCLFLLGVRCALLGHIERVGIFGNILLAWIPYCLALLVACLTSQMPAKKGWIGVLLLLWLLFLPNAAYIITDLTHWRKEKMLPVWFDWIFISAAAWVGLFLAFLSIQILHRMVSARRGAFTGWLFVTLALAASSFGIYAGRFFRWNSWDAILNVRRIFGGLDTLAQPQTAMQAVAFCAAYFVFSSMVYIMLHAISAPSRLENNVARQ